ncbi:uncharacterized protein YegP (UPF0339 family) [Pseudarthrobacter sp. PvP004]|uniref:YegP family protein n=2 Tax=Micrococcaceae TaxID=1268 RepID=UPI002570F1BF|nr:DUF1508 domain-containing protein [Pseudarthrobacter sp. PvP004]MBP2266110.1 uncharacterized protein YegP (UPF0339 family) [Pseudarthrobacter sp. PvP004]
MTGFLATRWGLDAVDLALEQKWGIMLCLNGTDITDVPLASALGNLLTVLLEARFKEAEAGLPALTTDLCLRACSWKAWGIDDAVISKCRRGGPMNGIFELFTDGQANVRFRLVDSEGRELAVSCSYVDKDSAVQGISHVRECAGMGLVQDHCSPMTPADTKPAGSRVPANGRMSRAAE